MDSHIVVVLCVLGFVSPASNVTANEANPNVFFFTALLAFDFIFLGVHQETADFAVFFDFQPTLDPLIVEYFIHCFEVDSCD